MKEIWQKIKVYALKTKTGKFAIENPLFFISIVITIIFVSSPIWLNCLCLKTMISGFLMPLREQGYKSSYIETFGAILGTFLAISGALWTQRREDRIQEGKIVKEAAVIIYYDFKFAFDNIFKFESAYACIKPGIDNGYDDAEYFIKYRKHKNIYIDANWITNVAKLCNIFSDEEIKQIYKIYGDLETVKTVFETNDEDIDATTARQTYIFIQRELCNLTTFPQIEISHIAINKLLMDRLEKITMEKCDEIIKEESK